MPDESRYARSLALFEEARRLIPGGIHLSGRPLLAPGQAPMYFERGRGCRVWDVDGHEYIDYIMAYGPFLLGYARQEVDAAVTEQAARGNLLSLNHPLHLRFLQGLLRRFPAAEMGHFFKTGSEATTAALRISRHHTGRRRVARCGYHGWHDWCLPERDDVPDRLGEQVLSFDANRPDTLRVLFDRHPEEIAAVIVAPEMVMPLERTAVAALMDLARDHGAVFVMDEVKTAFRTPPGSVQQRLDLAPDLTTLSKALGNGWPVAAVIGKREVLRDAEGLHLSATYHGETTAMAAALVTLDLIDSEGVAEHAFRLGGRLIEGLNAAAARHRVPARAYGEPLPPMPFLAFTHAEPERNDRLRTTFFGEMFARGILLHPRHMWFISGAHTDRDIEHTLDAADEAMAAAARAV